MPEKNRFSSKQINLMLIGIFLFYPLIGMCVDLIAPSLPAISKSFNLPEQFSKNLIAIVLLGYAIGNCLSGILSDAYGRRQFLIWGSFLFVIVSVLPAVYPSPMMLLLSRFLQGCTLGTCTVVTRGILADVLTKEQLMKIAPMTATMWGLGPIVGPVIGGYLQFYLGWQACFYFYAVFGLVLFLAFFFFVPETHFKRYILNLKQIKANFKEIFSHKVFIGAICIMGFSYSLLIVFNTLAPFLIQNTLGHSSIYFGHLALFMGVMFLLGTIVCRQMIKKGLAPERIIAIVTPISLGLAAVSVLCAYFWGLSIVVILLPSFCMFFTTGLLYPTAMSRGLALFQHLAGNAAAMMNLVNMCITSIVAALTGWMSMDSMLPLAEVYFVLVLLIGICYWFAIRSNLR